MQVFKQSLIFIENSSWMKSDNHTSFCPFYSITESTSDVIHRPNAMDITQSQIKFPKFCDTFSLNVNILTR